MDWVLAVIDQSLYGASSGNTRVTDLTFANGAVTGGSGNGSQSTVEEGKAMELQVFGDLLDETVVCSYVWQKH